MKKVWNWLLEVLPTIWGILWMVIITAGSIALSIAVVKWLLNLLGVM